MLIEFGGSENYSIVYWLHDGMKKLFYYLAKVYVNHILPRKWAIHIFSSRPVILSTETPGQSLLSTRHFHAP